MSASQAHSLRLRFRVLLLAQKPASTPVILGLETPVLELCPIGSKPLVQLDRVGFMYHPEPPNIGYLKSAQSVAPQLNVKLVELSVHNSAEIEGAFSAFGEQANSGLIVVPNVVAFANSELIVGLAERHHLPAIYPFAFFAREGGLISYGFDESDQFRQGAVYIDKILKGAKPADLPVQYPTKFEITINLRTAKALDINVPTQLLQLADQVIE